MPQFERAEIGSICLIQETENGRIVQLGLTEAHNKMLQAFLAVISKEHPLLKMGEEYDLVLKNNVCKKCKKG
jgi:hypothetical protein